MNRRVMSIRGLAAALLFCLPSTTTFAQDGEDGGGVPMPCGMECLQAAADAMNACREEGGSFVECLSASAEALRACREEAGCEMPEPPEIPTPCGIDCFGGARQAIVDCVEAGGTREECAATYRAELRECLDAAGCELPEPPERPRPCGLECFQAGRDAVVECREGDGSFRECAEAFLGAFVACREAAGCGQAEEEEDAEEVVAALVAAVVEFTRGDVNRRDGVDMTDAVVLLGHLFLGGDEPSCLDAADANDDGSIDVSDATSILGSLFLGTGPLPPPSIEPGIDPTDDDYLDCTAI